MARHIFVGGLLAGLLGGGEALQAQDLRDFAYADSLTTALAGQGSWRLLDSVGARALAVGTDYPALRQRLGYAALQQQKPALAVRHYGAASRANPADEASRYQLALAYLYLGQPGPARLAARPLPDSLRYLLRLRPWQAVRAVEVEGGARPAAGRTRGTAGFARLGLSSQLGARVALTQSGAYYGQQVRVPTAGLLPTYTIRQGEYHALLVTQLHQLWQLKLGYSYLFTRFGPVPYRGHLGYAALRYARPYWSAQVGLYAGRLTDTARYQPEAHLTVYPLGNLYLYAFGRSSVVRSGARAYPNALVG